MFKKIRSEDKTKYDNFYSSSQAETITSERDIDDVFKSMYIQSLIILLLFQSITL